MNNLINENNNATTSEMVTYSATSTLGELRKKGSTNKMIIYAQKGCNFGNDTLNFHLPLHEFYKHSVVANIKELDGKSAQRCLDVNHAYKMARYIFKGCVQTIKKKYGATPILLQLEKWLSWQPYLALPTVTCNLRSSNYNPNALKSIYSDLNGIITQEIMDGDKTACIKLWMAEDCVFHVIDGQHRRKAIDYTFQFIKYVIDTGRFPKKNNLLKPWADVSDELRLLFEQLYEIAINTATIGVELHLGCDLSEERQLFHDANQLQKKSDPSLSFSFDSSNPIGVYVKENLINRRDIINWEVVDKEMKSYSSDRRVIVFKDLMAINARLIINKPTITLAQHCDLENKEYLANKFWIAITKIPHINDPDAKNKTVAGHPVFLKALAKIANKLVFARRGTDEDFFDYFLENLPKLDLSNKNPIWQYYQMDQRERNKYKLDRLQAFLPTKKSMNIRNIGYYDQNNNNFKFGSNHNDIFPVLAGMVEFMLDNPIIN